MRPFDTQVCYECLICLRFHLMLKVILEMAFLTHCTQIWKLNWISIIISKVARKCIWCCGRVQRWVTAPGWARRWSNIVQWGLKAWSRLPRCHVLLMTWSHAFKTLQDITIRHLIQHWFYPQQSNFFFWRILDISQYPLCHYGTFSGPVIWKTTSNFLFCFVFNVILIMNPDFSNLNDDNNSNVLIFQIHNAGDYSSEFEYDSEAEKKRWF